MKTIILASVLVLAAGTAAMAQGGASSSRKNAPDSASSDRPVIQAPIGHRQPRAGDVPSEQNLSDPNNPVNKEDALLDKKIKSICRGC